MEKLKDFYCAVFCLKQGFRPKFTRNGFWLYAGDKSLIHLTQSDKHYHNTKQGFFDHFAFQMTGLKGLLERLDRLGVPYTSDYLSESDLTQIFFRDPCGIKVEVNFTGEAL